MVLSIPEVIQKKRDGLQLTYEEIEFFVQAVVNKTIDDTQTGAMLMAMYLKKLTVSETISLTKSMINSGEILRFENITKDILVDKHSTGGVGDKISLVLAPSLAACGLKVPMLSGRSLGYTGGTLDKLESIPGFKVNLNLDEMNESLKRCGCFISGSTATLAPADRILYKVRDITSTVEEPSLIAASILSKKAAEGISTLVIDVKFGKGSMFKTEVEAKEMAELLRVVGTNLDINMRVVISEMNNPLGKFVGNSLEIIESIMCLRNEMRNSVTELAKLLGGVILESKGLVKTIEEGEEMIQNTLDSLTALDCFLQMLILQGVSSNQAKDLCSGKYWKVLPKAPHITHCSSPEKGIVAGIDALDIARACWLLGGGRVKENAAIDPSVGVVLLKSIGDKVEKDEPWIQVHHSSENLNLEIKNLILKSLTVKENDLDVSVKLKTYIV